MGILRHRHIRRQEMVPNDYEIELENAEEDGGDDDYESPIITSSSINFPLTSTENPNDKATTLVQKVTKKVPSKYAEKRRVC
jgi:hypothetical protein